MKHQTGFTLIELILVIVILGILMATALPKFIDIKDDANKAALEGLRGAMDSTITLAHGMQITKSLPSNVPVSMAGYAVQMLYGYPTSGASGIMAAMDLSTTKYRWVQCLAGLGCSTSTIPALGGGAKSYGAIAVSNILDASTFNNCHVPYYEALVTGEKASTGDAVTTGC